MQTYDKDRDTHRHHGDSANPNIAKGVREDIATIRLRELPAWWHFCNESFPARPRIGFA